MLFDESEEGPTACLGLFEGDVSRFDPARMTGADGQRFKVPHMGWSQVDQRAHRLWDGIDDRTRFLRNWPGYTLCRTVSSGKKFICRTSASRQFRVLDRMISTRLP